MIYFLVVISYIELFLPTENLIYHIIYHNNSIIIFLFVLLYLLSCKSIPMYRIERCVKVYSINRLKLI